MDQEVKREIWIWVSHLQENQVPGALETRNWRQMHLSVAQGPSA